MLIKNTTINNEGLLEDGPANSAIMLEATMGEDYPWIPTEDATLKLWRDCFKGVDRIETFLVTKKTRLAVYAAVIGIPEHPAFWISSREHFTVNGPGDNTEQGFIKCIHPVEYLAKHLEWGLTNRPMEYAEIMFSEWKRGMGIPQSATPWDVAKPSPEYYEARTAVNEVMEQVLREHEENDWQPEPLTPEQEAQIDETLAAQA